MHKVELLIAFRKCYYYPVYFPLLGFIKITEFHLISYDRLGQMPNNCKVQR